MRAAIDLAPPAVSPAEELTPPRSRAWQVVQRLTRRRLAMVGAFVILVFVATAVLAPWLTPYDPQAANWGKVRKPADFQNWLGTDDLGRDILSRLVWGAQVSLLAGVLSVVIAVVIGV